LHDVLKSKQAEAERVAAQQATAVSEALEKLKSEMGSSPSVEEKEALAKKHADELAALRKKLVEQHEKDLKGAVDAAVETAKGEASAVAAGFDKQVVIDAAIAEYDAKIKAQHEAEIEAAVERGRREQLTKGKLKDAQLAKAQKRVKDFEAQILEWKNTGVLPQDATVASTPTASVAPPPSTPTATTAPVPSAPSAPSVPSAPAAAHPVASTSTAPPSQTGALPRKPSMQANAPAQAARGGGPLRGRGGPLGRGAATRVPPMRATPAQQAAAAAASSNAPATAPAPAGMSIMGAAAKRPREEGAASVDDSLAKRLKPSEGTGKGPVQLRRPPPGT
jgi:nucleoprotein TPR